MGHPDELSNEAEVTDDLESSAPARGWDVPVEDFAAAGPAAPETTDRPRDVEALAEELEQHPQPGSL